MGPTLSGGIVCLLSMQAVTAQTMNDYKHDEEDTSMFEIIAIVMCAILVVSLIFVCFQSRVTKACKKEPKEEVPCADNVELEIEVDEYGNSTRVRRTSEAEKDRETGANHTHTEHGNSRPRAWSTESPPTHLGTAVLLNLSEEQLDRIENGDTLDNSENVDGSTKSADDPPKHELDTDKLTTPLTSDSVPLFNLTPATPVSSKPSSPTNYVKMSKNNTFSEEPPEPDRDVMVDIESGLKSVRKPRDFYATPTLDRKDCQPLLASDELNTSQ
ncbi:uncharacterized protein [Littorina saxatilis]|uniref:Uncharacterized protein n=1 Tax=Littorina saxatilis TaxID=31220 RepID=A0AAN9BIB6_9CAEN